MIAYLETLCIRRGKVLRLPFHQARLDATLSSHSPQPCAHKRAPLIDLRACISQLPEPLRAEERVRCRILYNAEGLQDLSFHPYQPRPIRRLRLLERPTLDYTHKYADRRPLDEAFSQRGEGDDVLLLRNGFLTDTTIANLALFDGHHWYTPAHPLLSGTHRAALLAQGILRTAPLHRDQLSRFSRLRLFNAMLEWGEIDLPIASILP